MSMPGVPAQDLPENQDPGVRHYIDHLTNEKIDLDESGKPTVEIGADGHRKVDPDEVAQPANQAVDKPEGPAGDSTGTDTVGGGDEEKPKRGPGRPRKDAS